MKYAYIKANREQYTVQQYCQVLGVSRSGYYEWLSRAPSRRERENEVLLDRIKALHATHRARYGSPRIHAALRQQGISVSRGRVERLMRTHQIVAQRSRRHKRIYRQREQQQPAPNLLSREFQAAAPNQKWVSDITFIPTREGYLYLAVMLDIYSRAIVGWAMSERINGDLVLAALDMAITHRGLPKGVLVHSDQGSQYTAEAYRKKLSGHGMRCSMSRKGECHDNAVAESFFHTLKEELIHERSYPNRQAARQSIFKYIELYYNRQRMHSYLGYVSPMEYERMFAA